MIIGIEGPAGSGKTTMARTVAAEIGAVVIEGGAWYRAMALVASRQGVGPEEVDKLVALARDLGLTVQVGKNGRQHTYLHGEDVTEQIYDEAIAELIAPIAQVLPVREVIEPLIIAEVRSHDPVIIVGRHLRKALPEAAVLRVTIRPDEAERRHAVRTGSAVSSVSSRNASDSETAKLLGVDNEGITLVDVSDMSPEEQAEMFRGFVAQAR